MRLVYHGPFWPGSTARQRLEAFARVDGVEVLANDTLTQPGDHASLYDRIRWRAGWPVDRTREAERLTQFVADRRPDAVLVDSSKVIGPSVLRGLRGLGVKALGYYTPDDAMNPLGLKRPLKASLPEWDAFFTTKTFNLAELRAAGVRDARLVGKAFDPELHRPLDAASVGEDYERFDLVFAGACERERLGSLNALCEAGHSVVIYGGDMGRWRAKDLHPGIVSRPATFDQSYVQALHHGKLALGFLRKMNRDQITQRTMEITASGRPMLAEKTSEHDDHFIDGVEYAGFRSDEELVALAGRYLADDAARLELGRRARLRCLNSGYSTLDRAREMITALTTVVDAA
jgi:spore maturation protein CgeB